MESAPTPEGDKDLDDSVPDDAQGAAIQPATRRSRRPPTATEPTANPPESCPGTRELSRHAVDVQRDFITQRADFTNHLNKLELELSSTKRELASAIGDVKEATKATTTKTVALSFSLVVGLFTVLSWFGYRSFAELVATKSKDISNVVESHTKEIDERFAKYSAKLDEETNNQVRRLAEQRDEYQRLAKQYSEDFKRETKLAIEKHIADTKQATTSLIDLMSETTRNMTTGVTTAVSTLERRVMEMQGNMDRSIQASVQELQGVRQQAESTTQILKKLLDQASSIATAKRITPAPSGASTSSGDATSVGHLDTPELVQKTRHALEVSDNDALYDLAPQLFRRARTLTPQQIHVLVAASLKADMNEEAVEAANLGIDKLEKSSEQEGDERLLLSQFYSQRGTARSELHETSGGMDDFKHALALNPDNPEALNNASIIFFKEQRFEEAAAYLERSVRAEEKLGRAPEGYDNLALAYLSRAIQLGENVASMPASRPAEISDLLAKALDAAMKSYDARAVHSGESRGGSAIVVAAVKAESGDPKGAQEWISKALAHDKSLTTMLTALDRDPLKAVGKLVRLGILPMK